MATSNQAYALTICAYRKPGMSEAEYHDYLSKTHSSLLKDLLKKNKILEYTMTHNTTGTRPLLSTMFGGYPDSKIADPDCFVQIIFRDVQDYVNVKDDPYYQSVVVPDHNNFADMQRTVMVTGWFERHFGTAEAGSSSSSDAGESE